MPTFSAASRGLLSCQSCGLLCRATGGEARLHCPRCSASVHARKPNCIARTWALLIAAYILYIPANVLPILETKSLLESPQSNTIISGIILFWNNGSWFVAALIFFASFMVPLTKLLAMTFLLVSVQAGTSWQPYQRTQLYRFVEFIGRWSMLDIYVVALSVALVQVESFASMRAGLGSVAFGAVVVLTMFAAQTFDSRLIWDAAKEQHD